MFVLLLLFNSPTIPMPHLEVITKFCPLNCSTKIGTYAGSISILTACHRSGLLGNRL